MAPLSETASLNRQSDAPPSRRRPSDHPAKKKLWWQKSLVRRTASYVQADLEAITEKSSFLQTPLPPNSLAYFNRAEIRTGRLLGRGGFSEVYEIVGFDLDETLSENLLPEYQHIREEFAANAVDPRTGRGRYAIKHLQESLMHDTTEFHVAASDLALEAAYLARMKHPHILPLRGLSASGLKALDRHDGYFLILDRLEATLDQRIVQWQNNGDTQSCHDSQKRDYTRQLASALEYLHEHRILFRDLKPQNIGIGPEGQLQLFDFGLCRELPSTEEADDVDGVYEMSGVGTRRYLAPEIVLSGMYNARADVYSWAVVVWELWTLDKPYALYSMQDHAKFVCFQGERPSLDGRIPARLQMILEQAWCQSVAQRSSMSTVVQQLQRLEEDAPEPSASVLLKSERATTLHRALDLSSTSATSVTASEASARDMEVFPGRESFLVRFLLDWAHNFCCDHGLLAEEHNPKSFLPALTRACSSMSEEAEDEEPASCCAANAKA